MNLTRYEQETIITYNEEEKTAGVYTHNRALQRKLRQLSQERPEDCRLEMTNHGGQGEEYSIPKSWIKIYPPRQLSEEQRAVMAERIKANLSKKTPTVVGDSDHETPGEYNYIPRPENGA